MNYFIISQDNNISKYISVNLNYSEINIGKPLVKRLNFRKNKNEYDIIYSERIDYISKPCPMISDKLSKLFKKYDKDIKLQPITLINDITREQLQYWILKKETCNCLSDKTEYNKDKTIKKPVIVSELLSNQQIINVQIHKTPPQNETVAFERLRNTIVLVRLDLAESILRRDFIGLLLDEIEQN